MRPATWRSKNNYRFISKTTTFHLHYTCLYFRTTTTWKRLISRFMENVNKQRVSCVKAGNFPGQESLHWPGRWSGLGPVSWNSRQRFGPERLFYVCYVCIHDQSFSNFENETMNLSVNEAKLTSLWARNCAIIQQVLIFKFAFGPEKLPSLPRNGPLRP